MFVNSNVILKSYQHIWRSYFQKLQQDKTIWGNYNCMVGIVHPECLNMDSRTRKVYPISMKDDPSTGTMIPIVQIDNSHTGKLIPVARENDSCKGIILLASLQYDSYTGKIVQRVRIDDFMGAEVVIAHREWMYIYG